MSYSKDLREQAVKYKLKEHTLEETAEHFDATQQGVAKALKRLKITRKKRLPTKNKDKN